MNRWWIGLAALLLGACARPEPDRLVISGSSTLAPVVNEIAKRYEPRSGVRVEVQAGGSARGLAEVRQGIANIGLVSRALRAEEADLYGLVLAVDGIALVVHAQNPLRELEAAQVRAVYTGEIRDWAALGAPPGPITVIHKAEGRSTQELFLSHFQLRSEAVRADVVIGDNEQGLKTLASDPRAIAYVSIGAAALAEQRGEPVRRLALNGVEASIQAVREGRYPLMRPLSLVTRGTPDAATQAFLDYARSAEVHDLIEAFGFVMAR